jgi:putative transposase
VFLPDPGHAIFYPPYPLTISRVMEAIQEGATKRIHGRCRERGILFPPRFFDRALRTVREYHEKVEYIHFNPVKAALVSRLEDWPWSSGHDDVGSSERCSDNPQRPVGGPRHNSGRPGTRI